MKAMNVQRPQMNVVPNFVLSAYPGGTRWVRWLIPLLHSETARERDEEGRGALNKVQI